MNIPTPVIIFQAAVLVFMIGDVMGDRAHKSHHSEHLQSYHIGEGLEQEESE